MVFAAIMAGGMGSRMGNSDTPKQFLKIGNKPIIVHTVEKFYVNSRFEKIIVLCPAAWVSHTRDMLEKAPGIDGRIAVIPGGETRNDTLVNAVNYIEENFGLDDDTVIVTHDAVRPFVTHRIIEQSIDYTIEYGACDTVVPATDTIVESCDGEYISTIPVRSCMFQGQTPQSFKAKRLKEIILTLTDEEKAVLTDACKIYTLKGEPVHLLRGEQFNIKITYPFDLKLAQALLESDDEK